MALDDYGQAEKRGATRAGTIADGDQDRPGTFWKPARPREAGSPKGGEAASPKSSVSDLEKQGGTGSDEGNALSTLDLHGARVSFFFG